MVVTWTRNFFSLGMQKTKYYYFLDCSWTRYAHQSAGKLPGNLAWHFLGKELAGKSFRVHCYRSNQQYHQAQDVAAFSIMGTLRKVLWLLLYIKPLETRIISYFYCFTCYKVGNKVNQVTREKLTYLISCTLPSGSVIHGRIKLYLI